jgi:NAD-dependent dihydropyrimidine dehydrogenase PreA subunit
MPEGERSRGRRGLVHVHEDECKGCALCVQVCPVHGLRISRTRLNRLGYHPVEFSEVGCTGCGVCFYACPEPGALRVLRLVPEKPAGVAKPPDARPPDRAAPGAGAAAGAAKSPAHG